MKKIIAVLLVVVLAMSLAACSKFTCDICDEDKFGKKYTAEILGQEVDYCKDCKEEVEEAIEEYEDLVNGLGNLFG